MGEKHKHYDCIVAWANGEQIQFRSNPDASWDTLKLRGIGPAWSPEYEYRVKPKNVEVEMFIRHEQDRFTTHLIIPSGFHKSNVRMLFTPEGELLSVEKI